MAKRKRLTPAQPTYLSASDRNAEASAPVPGAGLSAPSLGAAPIAQVAAEASAQAALEELSGVLESARTKGLMIQELALDSIDEAHLVRDRLEQNEEEMTALVQSLRARGQQTPIEVVPLGGTEGKTYGLISGWRRLTALRRLSAETSEPRFATVLARVIQPETAQDAYVSMVEENEIRVNLSHYERARIAVRALREGVFETQKKALQGLFANAARSKRSKIGSFVTLVERLDDVLIYPTAISERLGLALVRLLETQPGFAETLRARLLTAERGSVAAEQEVLSLAVSEAEAALAAQESALNVGLASKIPAPATAPSGAGASGAAARPRGRITEPQRVADAGLVVAAGAGLRLAYAPDQARIDLTGEAVTQQLWEDLQDWLRQR